MNEQIKYWKLQKERGELELRYFALDGKDDRTAEESAEMQTLDGKIEEVRGKEMVANVAATEEAERSIVERTSNTPENRERAQATSKGDGVSLGEVHRATSGRHAMGSMVPVGRVHLVLRTRWKPSEFPLPITSGREVRREHRARDGRSDALARSNRFRAETMTFNRPLRIGLRLRAKLAESLGVELRPVRLPGASHHVVRSTTPVPRVRGQKPKARRADQRRPLCVDADRLATPETDSALRFEVAVEDRKPCMVPSLTVPTWTARRQTPSSLT